MMNKRLDWIDQLKGFTIFLVVYGHNYPILEKYIYSFHMPLFIIISGFFFPDKTNLYDIKKRFKNIIVPYFIWAFFLFGFWVLISKNIGVSSEKNLSTLKNFIGIFYAQGGMEYMDWGIPLWFLPMIFLCFLFYSTINYFSNNKIFVTVLCFSISYIGYTIKDNLVWSLNVAMTSLPLIHLGKILYQNIESILSKKLVLFIILLGISIHLILFDLNQSIGMYQSEYGNYLLFLINSIIPSFSLIYLFKYFPIFKLFEIFGRFSIVTLATHMMALSAIKFFIIMVFKTDDFAFSETEKIIISIVQMALLLPFFYFIERFIPIANGGAKK